MTCKGECDFQFVGPVQTDNGIKTLYVCSVCRDEKLV